MNDQLAQNSRMAVARAMSEIIKVSEFSSEEQSVGVHLGYFQLDPVAKVPGYVCEHLMTCQLPCSLSGSPQTDPTSEWSVWTVQGDAAGQTGVASELTQLLRDRNHAVRLEASRLIRG